MATQLSSETVIWTLRQPFRIADLTIDFVETLQITLHRAGSEGRGEALGVYFRGETIASMLVDVDSIRPAVEAGLSRSQLREQMPAGGARNAIDAALWDLEAKESGMHAYIAAGLDRLELVHTFYTLGLAPLEQTAADARDAHEDGRSLLKIKLDGHDDADRVLAVRDAAPGARLVVDANQSWPCGEVEVRAAAMAGLGVEMIEQPLPRGRDGELAGLSTALPIFADESFETERDLEHATRCYSGVNIKLDKTGGLTAALDVSSKAAARGLELMVGNMCGSSLAMAPAFLLAQRCRYVDLDGPLLNSADIEHGLVYRGCSVLPPVPALWG